MSEIAPAAGVPLRDRSRALIGWGWVLIVSGALCAMLVGLMALSLVASLAAPNPTMPAGPLVINAVLYLAIAALLVTLGVGSIRARRWARTLTLIVAWVWLSMGVLMLVSIFFLLPAMVPPGSVPGAMTCVLVGMSLAIALFLIALPLLLILFYRRDDVRRTLEARDPVPGWTERLPPSLLAIVLLLAFGGVVTLVTPFFVRAIPIFGQVLTGLPAVLVLVFMAAISLVLAVAVWRRSPAGWWGLMALQVVGIANALTFRSTDMAAYLRESGYATSQISTAQVVDFMRSPLLLVTVGVTFVATTAFLISVRRHFTRLSAAGVR